MERQISEKNGGLLLKKGPLFETDGHFRFVSSFAVAIISMSAWMVMDIARRCRDNPDAIQPRCHGDRGVCILQLPLFM